MSRSRFTVVSLAVVGMFASLGAEAQAGTTVLHSFVAPNAPNPPSSPQSALVMDQDGNLLGSTENGRNDRGTIFKLTSNNTFTDIELAAGTHATGDLTADNEGNIYGVTRDGGGSGLGTVFTIDRESGYSQIASFAGGTSGLQPFGGVVRDAAGNLYGTTRFGGTMTCQGGYGCGIVYRVGPGSSTINILHNFSGTDGVGHQWGLTRIGDKLWGTASGGAVSGVWMNIKTDGTNYTYGSFSASAFGPAAGLVKDRTTSNYVWGTTSAGGTNGLGAIVKITTSGTITVEASFSSTIGAYPIGRLVVDGDNNIYGVTKGNGTGGAETTNGTIFKFVPGTGNLSRLETFSSTLGSTPKAGLIMDAGKRLYGTTTAGGANSNGTIFRYDP